MQISTLPYLSQSRLRELGFEKNASGLAAAQEPGPGPIVGVEQLGVTQLGGMRYGPLRQTAAGKRERLVVTFLNYDPKDEKKGNDGTYMES